MIFNSDTHDLLVLLDYFFKQLQKGICFNGLKMLKLQLLNVQLIKSDFNLKIQNLISFLS